MMLLWRERQTICEHSRSRYGLGISSYEARLAKADCYFDSMSSLIQYQSTAMREVGYKSKENLRRICHTNAVFFVKYIIDYNQAISFKYWENFYTVAPDINGMNLSIFGQLDRSET